MSDLIARARKEWCEKHIETTGPFDWFKEPPPCPPEVVAALLDVLEGMTKRDVHVSEPFRLAVVAEAAITRALEGP
jgi:hypothetical protein